MSIQQLSVAEKQVVFDCLRASLEGPFFPDWEFHTLFGLERSKFADIVSKCPNVDDGDEEVSLAINNSFANLLGYPHGEEKGWEEFIEVSRDEVNRIFKKWRKLKGYA
jgi:hypothetical protein